MLPRLQSFRGDDIDIASEQRLQFCDKIREVEVGSPRSEVGQEVAVAGFSVVAAGSRADEGYRSGVMTKSCVKDGPAVGTEDRFSATHAAILMGLI